MLKAVCIYVSRSCCAILLAQLDTVGWQKSESFTLSWGNVQHYNSKLVLASVVFFFSQNKRETAKQNVVVVIWFSYVSRMTFRIQCKFSKLQLSSPECAHHKLASLCHDLFIQSDNNITHSYALTLSGFLFSDS